MKMPVYRVGEHTYVELNSFDKYLDINELEWLVARLQLEIQQLKKHQEKLDDEKRRVYVIQRCKDGSDWQELTERLASIDDAVEMIKRLKTLTGEDQDEWRVRNVKTGAIHLPARDLI